MAPRSSATYAKRQKERARQEKQQEKQQRKLQRKMEKRESVPGSESGDFGSKTDVPSHSEPLSDTPMAATDTAPTERESQ